MQNQKKDPKKSSKHMNNLRNRNMFTAPHIAAFVRICMHPVDLTVEGRLEREEKGSVWIKRYQNPVVETMRSPTPNPALSTKNRNPGELDGAQVE